MRFAEFWKRIDQPNTHTVPHMWDKDDALACLNACVSVRDSQSRSQSQEVTGESSLLVQIEASISYLDSEDASRVWKATCMSLTAHALQKRQSGEPYTVHPLSVVLILARNHVDGTTIAAGVIHDVIEDCTTPDTKDTFTGTLRILFGDRVVEPVLLVTKLQSIRKMMEQRGMQDEWINQAFASIQMKPNKKMTPKEQVEDLYRLTLLHGITRPADHESDTTIDTDVEYDVIRAIVIKLADRLHNMQTLGFMSKNSQEQNARETLDLFVPLAKRFGWWDMADELADLAIPYLVDDKKTLRALENTRTILLGALPQAREMMHLLGLTEQDVSSTGLTPRVPNLAAIVQHGSPYIHCVISTPDASFPHTATRIARKLRTRFPHAMIPTRGTIRTILNEPLFSSVICEVPVEVACETGGKKMVSVRVRVIIQSEETTTGENVSLLPLIQPRATRPNDTEERAVRKWRRIQGHLALFKDRYSGYFKEFTSIEHLFAILERPPSGSIAILTKRPDKGDKKSKINPWIIPARMTVDAFVQSIHRLAGKPYAAYINGAVASPTAGIMPYDIVEIRHEKAHTP